MARWEPHARMRLVHAAVELCAEQGYEATTVAEIAERAGLTKATFFRHFPDKREVLFAGQEEHSELLAAGIAAAPHEAGPLTAVISGLDRLAASFTPQQRGFGVHLDAAVGSSRELQERDALKSARLAAAVDAALVARGTAAPTARVAGALGVIALKQGFARWSAGDPDDDRGLAEHCRAALDELHTAAATLS